MQQSLRITPKPVLNARFKHGVIEYESMKSKHWKVSQLRSAIGLKPAIAALQELIAILQHIQSYAVSKVEEMLERVS